jgi:hypothetical protein
MPKTSALLCLLFICLLIQAQVKPPLAIEENKEGINPLEEIRLFDLQEIRQRKIDTVYIIYHPAGWEEGYQPPNRDNCSYSDTLTRYVFDREGRILEYTYFQQFGEYSTTIQYDTLGNRLALISYRRYGARAGYSTHKFDTESETFNTKREFIRKKVGADSLITLIFFMKFSHGLDTAIIETWTYNTNGKLIELQSSVNKRNARELDDDTGSSTYHYKYDYDDSGRLTYYRDYESREYEKISYPFYGRLTEVYDPANNQLKEKRIKLVKEKEGVITITFDYQQITLTPLEKGSRLFKLRTIVQGGEFPLMHYDEIVYKTRQ